MNLPGGVRETRKCPDCGHPWHARGCPEFEVMKENIEGEWRTVKIPCGCGPSPGSGRKPLENKAESAFENEMNSTGWKVTKRGWPDFICTRKGELIFVEVKRAASHRMKRSQKRMMATLSAHGFKCYRWDPEKGLRDWKDELG